MSPPKMPHRLFLSLFASITLIFLCTFAVGCDDEPPSTEAGEVPPSAGELASGEMIAGEDAAGAAVSLYTAPVSVRFDEISGLHLKCSTLEDCFTAQGYYHAAHRFTQMDINRIFPQGRVSERIGNLALDTDRASRLIFSTQEGDRVEEQMWEACSDESKRMLEAYARGVNAWLTQWRSGDPQAQLSDEYDFPVFNQDSITDWEARDSLSVALVLIQDLTESSRRHLSNAGLLTRLGPALYFDLYGDLPAFPTSVLTGAEGIDAVAPPLAQFPEGDKSDEETLSGLAALHQRLSPLSPLFNSSLLDPLTTWRRAPEETPRPIGSNNWVIAPSRSSTDHAWLSNDPHLGLSNPSVWYLAHLNVVSPEGEEILNVSGVSLPGIPSIIIGHNQHIAWGMTTTYFDFTDVYIEELTADRAGVIFRGQEVPFLRKERRYLVSGADEVVEEQLYVPHHGPVIRIDEDAGVAFTMRWTAQDTDTDVNFLLDLARARSVNEAREAIKNVTTIGQNFVVADDQGQIGWYPYNRLPSRPWASPELNPAFPLPGDGSAEWGDPIPYEDLPQDQNPDRGYIVTANHDMTGAFADGDPTNDIAEGPAKAMQESPANGYRYSQSTHLVASEEAHNFETLHEAIHDHEMLLARRILPVLIEAVDLSALTEAGQRLLSTLTGWGEGPEGYDCPAGLSLDSVDTATPVSDSQIRADSSACFAFHVLYGYLVKGVFKDELMAIDEGNLNPNYESLARLIARPEDLARGIGYWDDVSTEVEEDAGLTIALAMNDAGSYFNREWGMDPERWMWGLAHTVTLNAAIINDAGVKTYNNGPYPNHGGLYTVDVANPKSIYNRDFSQTSGASMRFVCELSSPPRCSIEIPGGQRHHRESPHYDDLLRRWLDREPTMLPFTEDDVSSRAVETLVLP